MNRRGRQQQIVCEDTRLRLAAHAELLRMCLVRAGLEILAHRRCAKRRIRQNGGASHIVLRRFLDAEVSERLPSRILRQRIVAVQHRVAVDRMRIGARRREVRAAAHLVRRQTARAHRDDARGIVDIVVLETEIKGGVPALAACIERERKAAVVLILAIVRCLPLAPRAVDAHTELLVRAKTLADIDGNTLLMTVCQAHSHTANAVLRRTLRHEVDDAADALSRRDTRKHRSGPRQDVDAFQGLRADRVARRDAVKPVVSDVRAAHIEAANAP